MPNCKWCKASPGKEWFSLDGYCYACHTQFTLERFGYKGTFVEYVKVLDYWDSVDQGKGAIC